MYCAASSIDKLQEGIQECVTEIQEWYNNNKNRLVINVSKSNILVINEISLIYMCNTITMCSAVANRVTRMSDASNMTVVPPASLEIFKNSFSYRGPII